MQHRVFTMIMIQNVKNFPASICNPDMKYKISEKQVTCNMVIGISVIALAMQKRPLVDRSQIACDERKWVFP